MKVPFFRPEIGEEEINEVVETLRSGWLTSGPRVERFEKAFAMAVGAEHAVAVNSCTAALHLAIEALGLAPGQAVLVPTMTFAATAEVVFYQGALPVLVDCEPDTLNISLEDAAAKLEDLAAGRLPGAKSDRCEPVGMIPVHVGGHMCDVDAVADFADRHGLWVVEDAAHALPAAWRSAGDSPWHHCGGGTSAATCFSFYANKTITTGEGGMLTTADGDLAERARLMSLHGLSRDAWRRHSGSGNWDYQVVAAGFKYNLTDIAAALGLHQLARAEAMRQKRQELAERYRTALAGIEEIELPPEPVDRIHSWHLFLVRLNLEKLTIDRNQFVEELGRAGIGFSVHWRPLHLHPLYRDEWGWKADQLPVATRVWERIVTLPLFSAMTEEEQGHVIHTVSDLCLEHRKRSR